MPQTTATGFPIRALPRELRDKIWEECFWLMRTGPLHPTCSPSPGHSVVFRDPNRPDTSLGAGRYAPLYTHQTPPIALVCRESREVAKRIWSNGQNGKALWEHECAVPVLKQIDTARSRTDPLVPLLAIHPPENHLVLDLKSELRPAPGGATSPLASPQHGRRLLDLLLAAKDDQIKVLLPETHTFCLPYGSGTLPVPPAAQGWLKETRLVSVNDVGAWKELKGIAEYYGLPWPFVDSVLVGLASRARLVEDAVRPLQGVWERESKRRRKQERLKPLPKIDAVVYVEVSRGGTMGMLGFEGVPDRAALKELLDYGVL